MRPHSQRYADGASTRQLTRLLRGGGATALRSRRRRSGCNLGVGLEFRGGEAQRRHAARGDCSEDELAVRAEAREELRVLEGRAVGAHSREDDLPVRSQALRGVLQRPAAGPHGREDQVPVRAELGGNVLQRTPILLNCLHRQFKVAPQGAGGIVQGVAALLHRQEKQRSVLEQCLGGAAQRAPILRDGRAHDLCVAPQLRGADALQDAPVPPHGLQHHGPVLAQRLG
mmetsp:Transcript_82891/g.268662  ORF Transcript_82891/g.268662 Transcript_82891/m.268662 type:complete len:228 (-) Transcript_82891:774-1457(-)